MKTVGKKKITSGFVTQTYNEDEDGKHTCVDVEFEAGDPVDYEDEFGEAIDSWSEYHPYHMVQPGTAEKLKRALECLENCTSVEIVHATDESFTVVDIEKYHEGLKLLRGIVNG